ncbi:MAG TPA: hypothetical protein VLE47_01370 [Candidatus Saccharimonadales bacterium]|nr:hypothetical protein [Candidatus Saccharimonadales bacterium]
MPLNLKTVIYSSQNFFLYKRTSGTNLYLVMQLLTGFVKTDKLPKTKMILRESLPQIFLNECFNEESLCFSKEVENTEIGHLFEHILLQNLLQKNLSNEQELEINGETFWNWKKETIGKFHIQIEGKNLKERSLQPSIDDSISLLEKIINSHSYLPNEKETDGHRDRPFLHYSAQL